MPRRRDTELDEALEGFYTEAEFGQEMLPAEERRNLLLPFLLGLVMVGLLVGAPIALWHWREQIQAELAERGVSASWMEHIPGKVASPTPSPTAELPIWWGRVVGTGGAGLRMRTAPGLDAPVLATIPEGTLVEIMEGPLQMGGRTWWKASFEGKVGWCAGDWLEVLPQGPSPTPKAR